MRYPLLSVQFLHDFSEVWRFYKKAFAFDALWYESGNNLIRTRSSRRKIMKKLIVLLAAALSFNTMAMSLDMSLTMDDQTNLKAHGENIFIRTQSVVSGKFSITVSDDGETQTVGQEIPPQGVFDQNFSLEIIDSNRLRIVDKDENIDQVIAAKIKKTMFGNLKTLSISKETLKAVYAESLEREGLTLLSSFGLQTDELTLSTGFDFTDMDCVYDKDAKNLLCEQSASLIIKASDEI